MEELSADRVAESPALPGSGAVPVVRSRSRRRAKRLVRWYHVLARVMHRTVLSVGAHGCLNVAQSTAYSAIVALFPALIVAAAVIGLIPDTAPVRFQLAAFFDRVLPPGVSPLLDAAFLNTAEHGHSIRALVTAGIVSFAGASNVISAMMEGLRRARELPVNCWSFWERRRRTIELVPLSLLPLAIASLLVVFGHTVTGWIAWTLGPELRQPIFVISVIVRWALALGSSVGVIGLIYHLGVPDARVGVPHVITKYGSRYRLAGLNRLQTEGNPAMPSRSWQTILPGAVMATAMWFLTTLVFGWYVTRFANYSEVYGSLGAGIALLFWLYIISLSVLCGAEFNAQLDKQFRGPMGRRRAKVFAAAEEPPAAADC